MEVWDNGSAMRIIRLAKQPKASAKITSTKDGGYIISLSVENEGFTECDSLMIPSGTTIDFSNLKKQPK